MNTVERIVAAYFQMARKCLTVSDVKVDAGNNRQFDLLACNLKTGTQYHVEVGVTHELNWCPDLDKVRDTCRQKFFGVPRPKDGENTDHKKEKSYLKPIKATYQAYGFNFDALTRVYCCWVLSGATAEEGQSAMKEVATEFGVTEPAVELLSLRDVVIPELTTAVGSSNYDDDILRTLSLLGQREKQLEKAAKKVPKAVTL